MVNMLIAYVLNSGSHHPIPSLAAYDLTDHLTFMTALLTTLDLRYSLKESTDAF